jgi:hypothetical protein
MMTADEQRELQLANAKADAEVWDTLAEMHGEAAEGQAGLIAAAERAKASAAAEHTKATEHAAAAKDRAARLARGEDVAGGLGKPLTLADVYAAGLTKADIARCGRRVHEVSEALGFDTMSEALREARDRAERKTLRALHRRIRVR